MANDNWKSKIDEIVRSKKVNQQKISKIIDDELETITKEVSR